MKNNRRKKDFRKIVGTILAIILALAMILSMAAPFFAAEINNSNITIDAKIGFEQKYKIGANTPFSVFVKNDGEDFNGELQVKIIQQKFDNRDEYSIYAHKLELPQGSTKNIDFNIIMPSLQKNVEISLVENGKTIATKIENCKPLSPSDTMIAVLTEDKESLSKLVLLKVRKNIVTEDKKILSQSANEMSMSENLIAVNDALIFFDQKSFPSNLKILNNFNALIINNYDTSRLSNEQLSILNQWINSGGNLILGTGINKDKVLKSLTDIIIDENSTKIPMEGLENEFSWIISKGNGKVLVHSFDLGLAPFADISNKDELLTDLYNSVMPQISTPKNNIDNPDFYYILKNILTYNNNLTIKLIFGFLALYIIIVGPILYIILRKKDKLENTWFIMPSIALTVTLIIYFISFATPYKKPIINTISIINLKNSSNIADINTALGVLSPVKGNIEVKFNDNLDITSNIQRNYYNSYNNNSNTKTLENIQYKLLMGDKSQITFYENQSWDLNSLNINTSKTLEGGVDIQLIFNDSSTEVVITNNTGYKLEDGIFTLGNLFAYCDYINVNETKKITLQTYTGENYNVLSNIFYKANYDDLATYNSYSIQQETKLRIKEGTLTREKAQQNMRRENELNNLSNINRNYSSSQYIYNGSSQLKANFYAFNNDILVDTSAKVNNKTTNNFNENIFVVNADVNLAKNEAFNLPSGIISVSDISSDKIIEFYKEENNVYISSAGDIDFSFELPKNIKLDNFTIYWEKSDLPQDSIFQIYNTSLGQWDNLYNEYTETADYIENDIIKVKLIVTTPTNIKLPNISIRGRN